MAKAPRASVLKQAGQYAYDNFLKNGYKEADKRFRFDKELPVGDKILPRPNHGLAHTLRVAMYVPEVVNSLLKSPQFTEKKAIQNLNMEKVQIALAFAIVGRENDSGYTENPVRYMQYRDASVTAFQDYCKTLSDPKFTQAEIQQYSKSLRDFGNPAMKDPLSVLIKVCHKLDLPRCYKPDQYAHAMADVKPYVSNSELVKLEKYVSDCIDATGDRKVGYQNYDKEKFYKVSTDVDLCMKSINSVKPGFFAQLWNAVKSLLGIGSNEKKPSDPVPVVHSTAAKEPAKGVGDMSFSEKIETAPKSLHSTQAKKTESAKPDYHATKKATVQTKGETSPPLSKKALMEAKSQSTAKNAAVAPENSSPAARA